SAIRTEIPAARAVSSSATPRLTTASSGAGPAVFASPGRAIAGARVSTIAAVMVQRFIGGYSPVLSRGRSADVWLRLRRDREYGCTIAGPRPHRHAAC